MADNIGAGVSLAAKEHWPPFGSHLVFLLQLSFPVIVAAAAAQHPTRNNIQRALPLRINFICRVFLLAIIHSEKIIAHYLFEPPRPRWARTPTPLVNKNPHPNSKKERRKSSYAKLHSKTKS